MTEGRAMIALVGYTGFVGSNICASSNEIGAKYNSRNIAEAYGTRPDLLVYAGLRAEKYLANSAPEKDMALILQAEENISKIAPKRLALVSTIDVFKDPRCVDESSAIDASGLAAYGYNRLQLEIWARERFPDALIIRLPALFGMNIKKNFIYDYINVIPFMLKADTFEGLCHRDEELKKYYELQENGFYKVNACGKDKKALRERFRRLGFSALNFTDSRSKYQFYNLANLWRDMNTALDAGITLWHPATEPVSAGELYEYLSGKKFVNILDAPPADYNYRTIHDSLFGGQNGYICGKEEVLAEIRRFVKNADAVESD